MLGLEAAPLDDGGVALYARDARQARSAPLVEVHGDLSAPGLARRATGLFHLALLFPDRRELGFALARVAQSRYPLDGASDHLVSEALYLSDPDGNGIELYRDRPRDQWRYADGQLQMATLPLDLDDAPYRDFGPPLLGYLRGLTADEGTAVLVIMPELVVRGWRRVLHNERALYVKRLLLFEPGIILASVPYQLLR